MNKKWIAVILGIVLAMSLFGGCSKEEETDTKTTEGATSQTTAETSTESSTETTVVEEVKEVELSFGWWGAENRHAYTQELADKFAEANPGTTFVYQPNDWGGYWEKIATQAAGGNLPTVMQIDISYLNTYAENDMFMDLTPFIEDGTIDISTIDEKLLQTGYYNGKLVAVPLSMSARAMIYNKSALSEAGLEEPSPDWTWDEFLTMAKTYTEKTGNYAVDGYSNHIMLMKLMLLQQGYNMYNDEGTALGFSDSAPLVKVYSFWEELAKTGSIYTPDVNATAKQLPAEQTYLAQATAAFNYGANTFPGWTGNEDVKLAPAPYLEVGKDYNWINPGMFFSIAYTADEATARKAAEFINWWLNSEEVISVQGTDRGFPASSEQREVMLNNSLTAIEQDTFDYFEHLSSHSGAMPPADPLGSYELSDLGTLILEELLFGKITAQEAADRAFEEFNAILSRNK